MGIRPDPILSLDTLAPAAATVQLGTLLNSLVTQVNALRTDLAAIYPAAANNRFLLAAPTLAINGDGGLTAKTSTAVAAMIAGSYVTKAADQAMSALVGTLATAKAALWEFLIDSAGTITTTTKTTDAASAAAALALRAAIPANKLSLGYIIVANASGSNFVGGTTALDATGITVTYTSPTTLTAMTAAAITNPLA
jgi:hypothetical protein